MSYPAEVSVKKGSYTDYTVSFSDTDTYTLNTVPPTTQVQDTTSFLSVSNNASSILPANVTITLLSHTLGSSTWTYRLAAASNAPTGLWTVTNSFADGHTTYACVDGNAAPRQMNVRVTN